MNAFEKSFEQDTVDGLCAVVFWPINTGFDEQVKKKYICVHLYDVPFSKTNCWFCIKKMAVPERGRVLFKVPGCMMGRVIGRDGVNIKKIAKGLGGRYVTVQKV